MIRGLEILRHFPFSELPESRGAVDWSNRGVSGWGNVYLPSVDSADASIQIFSKDDLGGREVKGPKMVHKFDGYIKEFLNKFGEEPVFSIDKSEGKVEVLNPKFIEWKEEGLESKGRSLKAFGTTNEARSLVRQVLKECVPPTYDEFGLPDYIAGAPLMDPVRAREAADELERKRAQAKLRKKAGGWDFSGEKQNLNEGEHPEYDDMKKHWEEQGFEVNGYENGGFIKNPNDEGGGSNKVYFRGPEGKIQVRGMGAVMPPDFKGNLKEGYMATILREEAVSMFEGIFKKMSLLESSDLDEIKSEMDEHLQGFIDLFN